MELDDVITPITLQLRLEHLALAKLHGAVPRVRKA